MPEQITQTLGFDASKAITALTNLDTKLDQLKTTLQATGEVARQFADKAKPMVTALSDINKAAGRAKTALAGLGAAPATAATSIRSASDSLGNFAQNGNAAVGASQHLAGAFVETSSGAQTAAKDVATTTDALDDVAKAGKKAGNEITVSWKTVIRIIQAQIIVRALSQIVSAFSEAQRAAADFSISVTEAFTISGGALGSIDQMNSSVLELANTLGLTGDEVAKGVYQTLSNQVTDASDALRFSAEAGKLSIATQSELSTAVNALSSVMNSYNLDVSETARVSDVLFKTIEFGRLRLDEFGDVLGRLSPLTAELGISYEEMAASIAALTQKGVPAHTAITQLTQVSQKLLRPTEGLKNLYEEWMGPGGSGPEAIKRFGGLTGVLLKMKDATAGNDTEFANLLGRVRSIVGALNLTSNEANAVTEALDNMYKGVGANDKAFQAMEESVGRKAVRAWNDLDNALTEAGLSLLEVTTPVLEVLGDLASNMSFVRGTVASAVGALAIYTTSTITATAATWSWNASLIALRRTANTLAPVILAIAAAMLGTFIGDTLADSLDKATEATARSKALAEELTKTHDAETQKRIQSTRREFEELRKITGEGFSNMSRQYQKDLDTLRASSKGVGSTLEATLDRLLGKRNEALKTIKDTLLEVDSAITSSMEEVRATQNAITEDAFQRDQRGLSEQEKLWREIDRAVKTGSEARKDYATAGADESKAEAARELSHIAERQAKEAVAHAERLGNIGDLTRAEEALNLIRANRIRAETTFQMERRDLQTETHKQELANLEEQGVKLKELLDIVKELSDPLTSQGALESVEKRKQDAERIAELVPEIQAQLDRAFDFSMFEKLGLDEGLVDLKEGISDAVDKAQFDWARILNDFQGTLSARSFEAPITLHIENEYIIEEFVRRFGELDPLGDPGKYGSQLQSVLEDTITKYESLTEAINQGTKDALQKVDSALEKITKDEWFNWWDHVKQATTEGLVTLGDAQANVAGVTAESLGDMEQMISPSEELRQRLESVGMALRDAINEQRNLTKAERANLNSILAFGEQLQIAGELSKNAGNQGNAAFKEMVESVKALEGVLDAANEKAKITPGAYEAAVATVDKLREGQVQAVQSQAEVTDEAGQTKDQLDKATEAQIALPTAAGQATSALSTQTEQASQLRIELEGATQAQRDLVAAQAGGTATATTVETPGTPATPVTPTGPTLEELTQQAQAARQLATELSTVNQKAVEIGTTISSLAETFVLPTEATTLLRDSVNGINESVISIGTNLPLVTEQFNLAKVSVDTLVTSITNAKTATDSATQGASTWNTMLQNCATSGNAAAQAMYAAAAAAREAAATCAAAANQCAGGSVTASKGGRYFQTGGRGTDTIPAWLTPGEFVVNAQSARRFFPQLQAINAGQKPIYREQGGHVTSIGDIHVSVQGGDTPAQSVREIANGLRRELRRKTITLN